MTESEIARRVQSSRRFATLLDAAWGIPYTRWRFGVDSLLGILPIAGDLAGAALGLGIVWQAHKVSAPMSLKMKMLGNIGLDMVLGSVPIVGDIADVAFRKNQRNAAMLERWAAERQELPRQP